jgi:hypothetical protein
MTPQVSEKQRLVWEEPQQWSTVALFTKVNTATVP